LLLSLSRVIRRKKIYPWSRVCLQSVTRLQTRGYIQGKEKPICFFWSYNFRFFGSVGHGLRAGREREARVKPLPATGKKRKECAPKNKERADGMGRGKKKKKNRSCAEQANRERERSLAERWRWRFALCESRQAGRED
jgi:hypothetical protein